MRYLCVSLAVFRGCGDEQAVGMIGKLTDQPPFLVGKLGAWCAPSRRLLALAHDGELQGEDAAKLVLRLRVGGEEGIGAIDQHAPKLEGLSGKRSIPSSRFIICVHMSSSV